MFLCLPPSTFPSPSRLVPKSHRQPESPRSPWRPSQPPLPLLPSAHPPQLPQHPVSQPRSSVGSFISQGSTPSPVASGVNSPVLTRTLSASSSSLSQARDVPPPPPILPTAAAVATPTATALAPSLSAHRRLRPLFHPFTRHNNLLYIHILSRLPPGHSSVNASAAGSEAASVSNARAV